MSTILEQAIIDAQALRDAALKNAETAILEKYGNEVRNAVESLLEQEEILDEEVLDEPEFGIDVDPMEVDEIPPAAGAAEPMCPCPDDGEEVSYTLSMDDLRKALDSMEGEDIPVDQEDLAMSLGAEEEEEALPLQEEMEVEVGEEEDEVELEEGFEFDDAMIQELVEELVVDMMPVKTGWLATPQGEMQYAEELELARRSGTEAQEQLKALQDAHDRLAITNESLTKHNQKLDETISALKDKVEKTLLENAKLLYMNQALNSASLNERQKSKVVESIRKADSVEEAKVIYETLQSAVGEVNTSKPKSLSEAIKRPSLTMPRRRTENSDRESILKERFQRLAGIAKTE